MIKKKSVWMEWVVPVAMACVIMLLVLATIPITGTPAKVFGGYGGGGIWYDYMVNHYSWNQVMSSRTSGSGLLGSSNLFSITIYQSFIDTNRIDVSSLTLNGVPMVSAVYNGDGNLVVSFDKDRLNLAANGNAMLEGVDKDGKKFTVDIPLE